MIAAPCPPVAVHHDAVVVCHRVVRRGRHVWDAARSGDRVVWIERQRRDYARVYVYSVRRKRVVRRIWTLSDAAPKLSVAVMRDGTLAWSEQRGDVGYVVVLKPHARRAALFRERGATPSDLGFEDGRTLRVLIASELRMVYFDLAPQTHDGCPRRRRFKTILRTRDIRVTRASYGDGFDTPRIDVLRACLRATGAEELVAYGNADAISASEVFPVAARPPFLVLSRLSRIKGAPDEPTLDTVTSIDLRTFLTAREAHATAGAPPPVDPAELAVTHWGDPAWIEPGGGRLLAAGEGDEIRVLDESSTGRLSGLRSDGDLIRWTHDGAPRSAALR